MKIFFASYIFLQLFFMPLYGQKNIVFLVGERYNLSTQTMPALAVSLEEKFKHKTYYINIPKNGSAENIQLVEKADLLVIYIQLRNLPDSQIKVINQYIESGKPVIAFNSTSRAFEKHPEWFSKYFGGGYRGKVLEQKSSLITILPDQLNHPILKNFKKTSFQSSEPTTIPGPLEKKAIPLLMGKSANSPSFPVAWTYRLKEGQKIFYTSLGVADDFKNPDFNQMIFNAAEWCLSKDPSPVPGKEQLYPSPPVLNAPEKAEILFKGDSLNQWRHWDLLQPPVSLELEESIQKFSNISNNTNPNWKIRNNSIVAIPGKGDIITKNSFGNYLLNLDFLLPAEPEYVDDTLRGSGGIFISGRYEVRLNAGDKRSNTGPISIYTLRPPDHEMDVTPGVWHNLQIHYSQTNKNPANVTIILDGRTQHGSINLQKPTPYGIREPIGSDNPVDQSLQTFDKELTSEKLKMADNPFTISTRFKTTSKTGTVFARTSQATGWERDGKAFFLGDGKIYYDIGWKAIIQTDRKVSDGEWHHAVLTNDGDMCIMYVDGEVAFMKKGFTAPDPAGHVLKIGYEFKNFYRPFQGEISNVRYYPRALTYEEVMFLSSENKSLEGAVIDWKPDNLKKSPEVKEDKHTTLKGPIRIHGDFSKIRYANIWIQEKE